MGMGGARTGERGCRALLSPSVLARNRDHKGGEPPSLPLPPLDAPPPGLSQIEKEEEASHQSVAVIGIGLIAMGEGLGGDMCKRTFEHILQYPPATPS